MLKGADGKDRGEIGCHSVEPYKAERGNASELPISIS